MASSARSVAGLGCERFPVSGCPRQLWQEVPRLGQSSPNVNNGRIVGA